MKTEVVGWLSARITAVWIALACLLLADVLGVVAVGRSDASPPEKLAAGSTSGTTTSTTATTPSETTAPTTSATVTTPAAVRVTTTTRPVPTATTTRPSAVQAGAGPRAGTYHYNVKTTSTYFGETESDAWDEDLVVIDAGGGRQRHRLVEDGEVVTVDEVAWSAGGRYLVRSMESDTPKPSDCDWQPDLQTLVFPAEPGRTWTFTASCTVKDEEEPDPYTITMQGTGRINARERTTVGGTAVDVVRIHLTVSADGESFTVDELYAPALGLTIEETYRSSGEEEDEDGHMSPYSDVETRRLVKLQPE